MIQLKFNVANSMLSVTRSQSSFQSGGKEIGLDCYLPGNDGARLPTIIGLHGSGGDFAGMSRPAEMLASHGFAVYVLHYFDRVGISSAPDLATVVRHYPAWMKTLWDTVSHVAQLPQVDPARIGLLGFSLGAYLSLCNASIDGRIKAVVEFFGGLPKEMKIFMRRFCPVLVLHGSADTTVPVAEAYHLQQVLEGMKVPYEIQIYEGEGHSFEGEVWQDAGLRTVSFLQKYLAAQ